MGQRGTELEEFTSDEIAIFAVPEEVLVWDHDAEEPIPAAMYAYLPQMSLPAVTDRGNFRHCAYRPGEHGTILTREEIRRWIALGKGVSYGHKEAPSTPDTRRA